MDVVLDSFLGENRFSFVRRLGRGHSAHVFLVRDSGDRSLVVKQERFDSTRFRMAERESEFLGLANSVGVGPKLFGVDLEKRIVLMEFVDGVTFESWLFSGPEGPVLENFVRVLFGQAEALDEIGLDHGQLAGRGRNILVRKNEPVIIDFEKASVSRKCHNLASLKSFLLKNPRSVVSEKVREILGPGYGVFLD